MAERYSIDHIFLEHLQETELSPGVAEAENNAQIHLRLNVPSLTHDRGLSWERVDVLCGETFVVVVEPRALTIVNRAIARFRVSNDESTSDYVSQLLAQLVDVFDNVLLSIERGDAARGVAGSGRQPTDKPGLRGLLGDLERASGRLRKLIEDLSGGTIEFVSKSSRNRLRVTLDRLQTLDDDIARLRERSDEAAPNSDRDRALGAESPEVIQTATSVGERRLRRLNLAHAITALLGAFGVSFGAIAMAWSGGPWMDTIGFEKAQWIGAFLFPIGFVITLVGKGELFTEDFFLPVTGVIRGRGRVRDLFELWGYVLFFNMVGSVIASILMSRSGVLNGSAADFLIRVSVDKVEYPFWVAFMKAVFAGWLMTIMTWLIIAATGLGTRILIIWMTGFLIVAGHFNHVVISAPEIFTSMFLGAPITIGDWFLRNFIPALLGNLIGGVVFVTLLGILQARTLEQSEQQNEEQQSESQHAGFWIDAGGD